MEQKDEQSAATVNVAPSTTGGSSETQTPIKSAADPATVLSNLDAYQATLEKMSNVELSDNFKSELSSVEDWFKLLNESERTVALYAILQQEETTQIQTRFFITVLQKKARQDPMGALFTPSANAFSDSKLNEAMELLSKDPPQNPTLTALKRSQSPPMRLPQPPASASASTFGGMFADAADVINSQKNLHYNKLRTPGAHSQFFTPNQNSGYDGWPLSAGMPASRPRSTDPSNWQAPKTASSRMNFDIDLNSPFNNNASWASLMNTPNETSFSKQSTPMNESMLNATAMKLAALSTVNNRIVLDNNFKKYRRKVGADPGDLFSSGGLHETPQRNNGGTGGYGTPWNYSSPGLYSNDQPYHSDGHDDYRMRTPRSLPRRAPRPQEDFTNLQLLNDIPAWLRALRLHKYTDNLRNFKWQDLVQLTDEQLDLRGVNALGARRKLLKVFAEVRQAQGLETPDEKIKRLEAELAETEAAKKAMEKNEDSTTNKEGDIITEGENKLTES